MSVLRSPSVRGGRLSRQARDRMPHRYGRRRPQPRGAAPTAAEQRRRARCPGWLARSSADHRSFHLRGEAGEDRCAAGTQVPVGSCRQVRTWSAGNGATGPIPAVKRSPCRADQDWSSGGWCLSNCTRRLRRRDVDLRVHERESPSEKAGGNPGRPRGNQCAPEVGPEQPVDRGAGRRAHRPASPPPRPDRAPRPLGPNASLLPATLRGCRVRGVGGRPSWGGVSLAWVSTTWRSACRTLSTEAAWWAVTCPVSRRSTPCRHSSRNASLRYGQALSLGVVGLLGLAQVVASAVERLSRLQLVPLGFAPASWRPRSLRAREPHAPSDRRARSARG